MLLLEQKGIRCKTRDGKNHLLAIKKWRTRIFLLHKNGCIESTDITFLRGIFQGDIFSPLIFCLALAPIRNILKYKGYPSFNTKKAIHI